LQNENIIVIIEICDVKILPQKLPVKYKKFKNVFNNESILQLPNHRLSLNYSIYLKLSIIPPYEPLYNFFEIKLKIFRAYIDINLVIKFIQRSRNSAKALILFVKKTGF
jgi:hypothetical protein